MRELQGQISALLGYRHLYSHRLVCLCVCVSLCVYVYGCGCGCVSVCACVGVGGWVQVLVHLSVCNAKRLVSALLGPCSSMLVAIAHGCMCVRQHVC